MSYRSNMSDAGDLGEDLFRSWCTQTGLVASRPYRDRNGWDFLVEFPRLGVDDGALDARAPQICCKVQVKSTTALGKGRAKIKLDNWERMASDPIPWFVFAIALDGSAPRETYLVHIGEEWVTRVLLWLRELRQSGSAAEENLHKETMPVTWGDEDRLEPIGGESIRGAILGHVGTDPRRYRERKENWIEVAGYEDNPRQVQVAIKASTEEALYENMRDFALGIIDRMPFDLLTITDHRFGIPITEADLTDASDEVKLGHLGPTPPYDDGIEVLISDAERTEVVAFLCRVYSSQWAFPTLPIAYWQLRYVSDCIEILMDHPTFTQQKGSIQLRLRFPILADLTQPRQIRELLKFGRAIRIAAKAASGGLRIELRRDDIRGEVMPVHREPLSFDPDALKQASIFECLDICSQRWGLDGGVKIIPAEVLALQHRWSIMRNCFCGVGMFPISCPAIEGAPWAIDGATAAVNEKSVAFLIGIAIPIERDRLIGAFALIGNAQWVPESGNMLPHITINHGEVRVLWTQVAPESEWSRDSIATRLRVESVKLASEGIEAFPLNAQSPAYGWLVD